MLEYCTKTGLLATDACKKTDTGTYKTSFKPDYCTCGAEAPVTPTNPTTPTTPSTSITTGGSTTDTTITDTIPTESTTLPSDPMVGTTTAAPVTPGDENGIIPTP